MKPKQIERNYKNAGRMFLAAEEVPNDTRPVMGMVSGQNFTFATLLRKESSQWWKQSNVSGNWIPLPVNCTVLNWYEIDDATLALLKS